MAKMLSPAQGTFEKCYSRADAVKKAEKVVEYTAPQVIGTAEPWVCEVKQALSGLPMPVATDEAPGLIQVVVEVFICPPHPASNH